jgi:N-acetylmuramoyl-L-alanine amidase
VVDLFDNPADAAPPPAPRRGRHRAGGAGHAAEPAIKLPPAPAGKRDIIVVIDAGHGGEDPGASGSRGQREKDVVLQIARELQRQVNGMKGFRAELTRTGDYFIPLRGRTEIARKKGADLFVSIHADAAPSAAAFGASVFALSDRGATSETARWLADSENRSDLIGGAGNVSLDDKDRMLAGVLLDLSMTASLTSSLNVGQKVLSNIGRVTPLHKQRVEQAGFMVLKSPDIPSILVETGFISNANEASNWHRATSRRWRARSAAACASSSSRTRHRAPTSPGCVTPARSPRARVITACARAKRWR